MPDDIQKLVEESKQTPPGFTPPTFEFDGFTFDKAMGNWSLAVMLDMAYRARREIGLSSPLAMLLTDLNITIKTADGRSYWPPETTP